MDATITLQIRNQSNTLLQIVFRQVKLKQIEEIELINYFAQSSLYEESMRPTSLLIITNRYYIHFPPDYRTDDPNENFNTFTVLLENNLLEPLSVQKCHEI